MTLWTVAPTSWGYGSPRFTTFNTETPDLFLPVNMFRQRLPKDWERWACCAWYGCAQDGLYQVPGSSEPGKKNCVLAQQNSRWSCLTRTSTPPSSHDKRQIIISSSRYSYILVTALHFLKMLQEPLHCSCWGLTEDQVIYCHLEKILLSFLQGKHYYCFLEVRK